MNCNEFTKNNMLAIVYLCVKRKIENKLKILPLSPRINNSFTLIDDKKCI